MALPTMTVPTCTPREVLFAADEFVAVSSALDGQVRAGLFGSRRRG